MPPMEFEDTARINPFTLRFRDNAQESAFRNDFYAKNLFQLRWNVLLGAFLYGILGIIDYLIIPDIRNQAWIIRYCFVCPIVLAIYFLTFTGCFRKLMQPLLVFGGLVASAGAVGLNLISPLPVTYLYFTGILLCLIYFYTFVGMRFTTSAILSWSSFFLYEFAVKWKPDIPSSFHIHNTLVFLAFNLTGMWGSYVRERYMLSDFLHRRTIQEQEAELRSNLQFVEEARREAENISRLDPLTNLYNRRHFFSVADFEFERAKKKPTRLSLIMLDIDHFKTVNDTHGHQAGDAVLLAVTEIIINAVRSSDIVCRYGGEEFVILLPETEPASALAIAERLRETFEISGIPACNAVIKITASIGIASMSADGGGDIDELLKRADEALYEAKLAGRNMVRTWQPVNMNMELFDFTLSKEKSAPTGKSPQHLQPFPASKSTPPTEQLTS